MDPAGCFPVAEIHGTRKLALGTRQSQMCGVSKWSLFLKQALIFFICPTWQRLQGHCRQSCGSCASDSQGVCGCVWGHLQSEGSEGCLMKPPPPAFLLSMMGELFLQLFFIFLIFCICVRNLLLFKPITWGFSYNFSFSCLLLACFPQLVVVRWVFPVFDQL